MNNKNTVSEPMSSNEAHSLDQTDRQPLWLTMSFSDQKISIP
jgi:hypothetical protein